MNQKHQKWDPNWQSQIKIFGSDLEPAKSKQVGTLLTEGNTFYTEKGKLQKEIKQLKREVQELSSAQASFSGAKRELNRLTTHQTTHNPREAAFLGTNSTGAKYQTNGWLKQAEDHFKPTSGTLDNLYQVKNGTQTAETTEEQVIQTIARVVKALQKIDSTDFEAKYNAKETDTLKQAQLQTYLAQIKAQEIVVGSSKDSEGNSKQPSYDFASTYQKFDKSTNTWTAYPAPAFNYQHFFDFLTLTHNQAFLADLDKDKQKQVDKNEPWQIWLKGDKWEVDQLKDYGINIDSSKTILYKTSDSNKNTIATSGGIGGWLDLAYTITQDANNQNKLVSAFTNSPTQQLLTDLKSWTQGADGYTTNGTYTLPESLESMEEVVEELKTKKSVSASQQAELAKQIQTKKSELKQKNSDLKAKETELDKLIKEMITKQREQLITYKIAEGFANQHKRTASDLYQIKNLLENIRYLENEGDDGGPSSVTAENTAYGQIETILEQISYWSQGSKTHLVHYFQGLAEKKVGDKWEYDLAQALQRVKAGKYTGEDGKEHRIFADVNQFSQHFEAKDKLVKLTDWEQQVWKALKEDKEAPEEKLTDWQTKLKALDPLLTEVIITEAKMKDFQKHVNFKKINGVEGLLKEVMGSDNKVKGDFISALKKEDAEVDDLAKMITKFEAEKIIKLIKLFAYEKNLTEDKQKEYRRKFSWDRDKKVNGKYVGVSEDYDLTEEEKKLEGDFTKFLFELATGAKQLNSISKPTEQDNPTPQEQGHLAKHWWKYGLGVIGVGGIALVAIFWKQISAWWEAPAEGESKEDNE